MATMRAGDNMAEEMDIVPPDYQKTRRSMSIHSICDPLASSISTLSDHDSEATLIVTDRVSIDGDPPKYDSLSPSEEQAVRALEDLRADTGMSPQQNSQDFLNRVQGYSIVNSAVKAWDQGKNYNRALKWGGEMVESVVGGVVQRLEPLEPFANRQLDRLESYKYPSPPSEKSPNGPLPPPRTVSPTTASRWQTVLISTGGLTASISEQSLASLVYCLRFLRVATEHMGSRITDLHALLSSVQRPSPADEENQAAHRGMIGPRIEKIKQDIVDMLRKAVDVVSRHAGAALPDPARRRVKMYILSLPSRWAAASTPSQPNPATDGTPANGLTREEETGWKVLTLAGESLQMLGGVMTVVADTLQSAEEWAGRLGRNKRTPVTPPESIRDEREKENGADEMNIDE